MKDLEQILRTAIRAEIARIHTQAPARIISYDASQQRATVQLLVDHAKQDDEKNVEQYVPAQIPNVPVAFPSGGGFAITWPIEPGDEGWIEFSERSISEFKTTKQNRYTPQSLRRFDLTDAVFKPENPRGKQATVRAGAMVFTGNLFVFGDKNVETFLARADKVTERLNAIEQYLQTHEHFYVNPAGGLPLITTGKEPPIGPTTVESQIRCNKIKGE
jgi:hypothetical protein